MGARRRTAVVGTLMVTIAHVVGSDWITVAHPISQELRKDPRNSSFHLVGHCAHLVERRVLVLDLRSMQSASTADLTRGFFQVAAALWRQDRRFRRVILARSGKTVFYMDGDDFATVGREFAAGQNPIYLLRTLPEKLYRASGERAFGSWEGGWLGVVGRQMEDVNAFGVAWASGG